MHSMATMKQKITFLYFDSCITALKYYYQQKLCEFSNKCQTQGTLCHKHMFEGLQEETHTCKIYKQSLFVFTLPPGKGTCFES